MKSLPRRHRIRGHPLPLDVLRKTQIPGRQCPDPRNKAQLGVGNMMFECLEESKDQEFKLRI